MRVAYVAVDAGGREVQGSLEAADVAGAALDLRARGLFPVRVTESAGGGAAAAAPVGAALPSSSASWWVRWAPVRAADRALFLAQAALMLRTGLTLLQALNALGENAPKPALAAAARRLASAVQGGEALSDALERERRLFPPITMHLVRTAEATGELDQAFTRAAEYIERRAELRGQVLTSLLYPAIVVLVSTGVFWFLAIKVIPKFAAYLSRRQVALPWSTQLLVDISTFLREHGLLLAGGALVAGIAAWVAYRTPPGRRLADRAAVATPGLGWVVKTAAMAHLSRTLGLLLRSGHALFDALKVLEGTFESHTYAAAVRRAREGVIRGAGLARSLEGPEVTPLCVQVIKVGEETGALDTVLAELSTFYEARLQRALRLMASLIEPVVLLVVGGMVGFVYLSFFQAVFRLSGG